MLYSHLQQRLIPLPDSASVLDNSDYRDGLVRVLVLEQLGKGKCSQGSASTGDLQVGTKRSNRRPGCLIEMPPFSPRCNRSGSCENLVGTGTSRSAAIIQSDGVLVAATGFELEPFSECEGT